MIERPGKGIFNMTPEQWRKWCENAPEDPEGCTACGAMAGCCPKYPNCPGNPAWSQHTCIGGEYEMSKAEMSEKSSPSAQAQVIVSVKATLENGDPVRVEFYVHDDAAARSLGIAIGGAVTDILVIAK